MIPDNKRQVLLQKTVYDQANTYILKALFRETEELLEKWKHPDPYRAPTAPGGMLSYFWVLAGPSF